MKRVCIMKREDLMLIGYSEVCYTETEPSTDEM